MNSRRLIIFILVAVAGCTPDAYRADADRQVQKLIRERQADSTGYTPTVDVEPTTQPQTTKKSYTSVPLTDTPPGDAIPMRRLSFTLPAAPAGPPAPPETALPDVDSEIFASAQQVQRARLEYGPPSEVGRVVKLDLFAAISYAVQNGRQYQSEMERLYLAALDVTLERHLFTPRPFATTEARYTGGQSDVDYRSAFTVTQRAGVRQRLPYGGEIVAQGLVSFVNALNDNVTDGEDAQLAIDGTIPLLRGAGLVNLEGLISSERELIYATRGFETYRRTYAVDVAARYFRVLTRYQSLRNRFINFRNLLDLVDRSENLFAAGRVTALEVQRAQQSLLSAEDLLNTAQLNLQTDLDDFKTVIGMPVEQPLDLVPVDVEVSELDAALGNPEAMALIYRLDLQTARDRIDDARRGVSIARNDLGPSLDLSLGGTMGNQDSARARRVDSRTLEYNAGLTLDLPIDRLAERNDYRRSLISLDRAQREAVDLQQNVLADVRAAERGIRSAQQSLNIQRRGIDVARKRLEAANDFLLLGVATSSRDVVEAQASLLNAQDAFDRARADLTIQMLQFLRDTGTLRLDPGAGALGIAMKRE
ncbi:MAG: TolC family protein [Burkholderiales bacterium]|nr:TolC family protein [Phycisphaerae bacterium]